MPYKYVVSINVPLFWGTDGPRIWSKEIMSLILGCYPTQVKSHYNHGNRTSGTGDATSGTGDATQWTRECWRKIEIKGQINEGRSKPKA